MKRAASIRLLACALLMSAADAGARNMWGPNTKTVAHAAQDALRKKHGGQLVAARLVKNDADAMTGFHKLISAAATTADRTKRVGIPPGIADGLGRLVAAHGEDAAQQFLKDMDVLYEWAKAADGGVVNGASMQMLGEIARKFGGENYNNWKGAWFELQLAAHHAKSVPPGLQRLQPQMPPFHQAFRDGKTKTGNVEAYAEWKNWPGRAAGDSRLVHRAGRELAGQLDGHFKRLKSNPRDVGFVPPASVPTVPPGLQLHYEFSEALPPQWKKALVAQAEASLYEHFKHLGMTKQGAKNWARDNLKFNICQPRPTPFRCAPAP